MVPTTMAAIIPPTSEGFLLRVLAILIPPSHVTAGTLPHGSQLTVTGHFVKRRYHKHRLRRYPVLRPAGAAARAVLGSNLHSLASSVVWSTVQTGLFRSVLLPQ